MTIMNTREIWITLGRTMEEEKRHNLVPTRSITRMKETPWQRRQSRQES